MATQRQYEPATVFNVRCVDMRHLWVPSDTFKGQKTQKPNYFGMFIAPKTQAHWSTEPIFGNVMGAFGKLLQGQLSAFAQQPNAVNWPIGDGDLPSPEGKSSEFAKGHWLFSASTGNAPTIELVQAGGALVKLQNKIGVKPGDHCMLGLTAAVKQNDPRGVKFYLNGVVFSSPGEEIVFANGVSGADLMRMAEQQGLRPTGFNPSPGGFGGAPHGGFMQPPQGGFHGIPQGQPQGFAPSQGPAGPSGPAFGVAPGPGGMPNGAFGNVTFPSNPAPGPFGAPPAGPWGSQR